MRVGNTSGVAFSGGAKVSDRGGVESGVEEGIEKEVVEESRFEEQSLLTKWKESDWSKDGWERIVE